MKAYLNDKNYVKLEESKTNRITMFLRKGSYSWTYMNSRYKNTTYMVGEQKDISGESNGKEFISIYLRLDDMRVSVSRREYDVAMWFIAIGGIERVYKKLFGFMVWGMTYKMFQNAVLGSLFLMKKNRDKANDYDPDDPEDPHYKGNMKEWKKIDPKHKKPNNFVCNEE